MKLVLSVDPIRFPLTGIGRYTFELACGLQAAPLERLLFMRGLRLRADLPALEHADPHTTQPAWKRWALRSKLFVAAYSRLVPWLKGRALRGLEDHLYHGPNFYLPPFGGCSVATFHDLSHYLCPQYHPAARVRHLRAECEHSLRRASLLITDTEHTRHELANYFNWPLARVRAIHLAAGPEFHPRTAHVVLPCLQRLGLRHQGYTLYAGTIEPRKNLDTLLDAYAQLEPALRQRWPLVLAGYRGWNSAALHQRLQAAQAQGWLHYLGFVAHDDLPLLMAGARLFAYPSHYEGFGLPVLEAMASGVPVLCSNASTLPEVAGQAAAMHHPDDCSTLNALLQRGLLDEAWCAALRRAGLERAQQFSWARCCAQTLDAYRCAAAA